MADMTVTWKGAVRFDSFKGQNVNKDGSPVDFDVHAMVAGFDIVPFHGDNVVSALDGAIPYMAAGDDSSWVDDFEDTVEQPATVNSKPARGRPPKKAV